MDKVVDLGVNTRALYIKDIERKVEDINFSKTRFHYFVVVFHQVIITQHPLHQISYCAEDRRYDNIFAYIIKHTKKDKPTVCYVYETMDAEVCQTYLVLSCFNKLISIGSGQASEIAATVGQAFQLAYNRFQDAKAVQLGFKDMKDKASKPPVKIFSLTSVFSPTVS